MVDVVAEWTPAQVAAWITTTLDMPLLAGRLRKMGVTGKKLLLLDSYSGNRILRATYEVSKLGDRLRILDAIQKLRDDAVEREGNARWTQLANAASSKEISASHSISESLGRRKKSKHAKHADNSLATIAPWRANAFPPMGFVDPEEAGRVEPAAELELDFVYGYRGHDRHCNLFYTASGELVYTVTKLCVVFNLDTRSQRFFTSHQDDVTCICMHEDGVLVASGEAGRRGKVFVWDSQSMEHVQTLSRTVRGDPNATAGVSSVAFAPDKDRLVIVGEDMEITVWDWLNQTILVEASGGTGKVFAAKTNPFQRSNLLLVTAGTSCVRFWTLKERSTTLEDRWGVVRELGTSQSATCIDFLDKTTTVTGMQDGSIYVWQGFDVVKSIDSAHGGAVFDVCVGSNFLLSGGQDGKIHKWSLGSKSKPGGAVERTVLLLAATVDTYEVLSRLDEALEMEVEGQRGNGEGRARGQAKRQGYWDRHTPCVRSLALLQDAEGDAKRSLNIAFGLESNQIMQLETGPALAAAEGVCQVVLNGHAGAAVHGMALHPQQPLLCTAGADEAVRLWDLRSKRLLAQHRPPRQGLEGDAREGAGGGVVGRACDFSARHPNDLAVGLEDGGVLVLAYSGAGLSVLQRERVLRSEVTCVRFSPCGERLAVAHKASAIVLLARGGGEGKALYQPLRTLSVALGGHAVALDWSEGGHGGGGSRSLFLQGTTNVSDLLFWEVDNGRQLRVTSEMRDVGWSTYNCPVGWPLLGLFSGGKHPHEVSCVERVGKDLVVAGSTEGSVLLARFPALDKTKLKVTAAHAGEVRGIRSVTVGGVGGGKQTLVVSVGADMAIMQWRMKRQSRARVDARGPDGVEDPQLKVLLEPWPTAPALREFVPVTNEMHWRKRMAVPQPGAVQSTASQVTHLNLKLEMVHGYSGQFSHANIFCSEEGELIYPVGRIVVVLDVDKQHQKQYSRHTAPVSCMAVCDVPQDVLLHFITETQGAPPNNLRANESLVASAQAGKPSFVHVWDAGSMERHSKLELDIHIWRIAFAGDDRSLLAMVAGEKAPVSIAVWEWINGTPLAEVASDKGPIMHLSCNPFFDRQSLEGQVPWAVTCHAQEVVFWGFMCNQSKGNYLSHTGSLHALDGVVRHPGEEAAQPPAVCTELLNAETLVSGMGDGDILVWRGVKTVSRIRRAHAGAVLALAYAPLADDVVSGGKDGVIKVWQGSTMASSQVNLRRIITGVSRHGDALVRAICAGRGNLRGRAAVGLSCNEMKEVVLKESSGARSLTHSHQLPARQPGAQEGGGVRGQWGAVAVCAHPSEERYVSAGVDGHVRVWEVGREGKGIERRLAAGLLCCGFSGDGVEVAVGGDDGRVWVLLAANLTPIAELHQSGLSAVTALSFAPDGSAVAVGGLFFRKGQALAGVKVEALPERQKAGHAQERGWRDVKALRCEGRVRHVDWSAEGGWLQVATEAGEMVYLGREGVVVQAGSGNAWGELRSVLAGRSGGWETWTAQVGWAVQGLLSEGGGEVSASDGGFRHSLLVAGGRDGSVQLSAYPCDGAEGESDRRKWVKHAGAVWGVCFVGGRQREVTGLVRPGRVVSVGLGDAALYQWLLVDERKAATDMQRLVRGNKARKAAQKKRKAREEQARDERERAAAARRAEEEGTQAAAARAAEERAAASEQAEAARGVQALVAALEERHGALVAALQRRGVAQGAGEGGARALEEEVRRLLDAQQSLMQRLADPPA